MPQLPSFAAIPSLCAGGPFCATPKAILEHMGGEVATAASLTLANVKSHLQASRGNGVGLIWVQVALLLTAKAHFDTASYQPLHF